MQVIYKVLEEILAIKGLPTIYEAHDSLYKTLTLLKSIQLRWLKQK